MNKYLIAALILIITLCLCSCSTASVESSDTSEHGQPETSIAEETEGLSLNTETEDLHAEAGFKIIEGTPLTKDKLVDYNLEEYHNPDESGFQSMKDFLDGLDCTYKAELKSLYWRGYLLSFKELSSGTDFVPRLDIENRAVLEDEKSNMTFFETGFTYDSFYGNYTNVFTKETADKILEMYPWFLSYNEELWIMGVSGGGFYTQLPHEEYEVLTQTDKELVIRRTLFFYDWVSAGEEYAFDPDKKDLYVKTYSECKFVLTDDGWRIETFFDTFKSREERYPDLEENTSVEDSSATSAAPASDISEVSARAAALAHAGIEEADAYFIKTKLDYDNGKAEYDIEFTAGGRRYEYEIDASSGAVLEYSCEKSPVQPADFISDEKARSVAFEHCGVSPEQAFGVKTELDEEDGEFEVKFEANGFEYEVKIDARTGTVLEFEIDD